VMLWHQYTGTAGAEKVRPRYEDDHVIGNGVDVGWWQRERDSLARIRMFLAAPWTGPFGCGSVRTFDDYQAFAGINFVRQCTTDYTRRLGEPPNPPEPADWADRVSIYQCEVNLRQSDLDHDCTWVTMFLWDANAQLILKMRLERDAFTYTAINKSELARTYRVSFASQEPPTSWHVQTYSKSGGWGQFSGASSRAWVSIRRTSPFEVIDWPYQLRVRERQRAERDATDLIEGLLKQSRSLESD
jgi:hypothetical protein